MVTTQIFTLSKVSYLKVHGGQDISGVVKGHLVKINNIEFLHRIAGKTLIRYMNNKYIALSNESNLVLFLCVNSNPIPNHIWVLCGLFTLGCFQ